jgi:hypothetical protein
MLHTSLFEGVWKHGVAPVVQKNAMGNKFGAEAPKVVNTADLETHSIEREGWWVSEAVHEETE